MRSARGSRSPAILPRGKSNGAISLRGRILNPNVWETANALIALMRCNASAYRAVIAKGFEFLDANWMPGPADPGLTSRDAFSGLG